MNPQSTESPRTGALTSWILTTTSWTAIVGAVAFYFLQWYGTVVVLLAIVVMAVIGSIGRHRNHPLLTWAIAGLAMGHLTLVSLGLLALARS